MTGPARPRALACLLTTTLVAAPAAMAQGLSPQVDRDSPAGVEYQLPVQTAREQASGNGAGASGAADREPLFGAGVTGAPRANPRGGRRADRSPRRRPREPAVSPAAPSIVRAQAPAPAGGLGNLAPVGAAGAAVLLVGVAAGLAWRRRAQRA